MSKASRLVQPGFANGERKLKQRWEQRKVAKAEDRLGLLLKKANRPVRKGASWSNG